MYHKYFLEWIMQYKQTQAMFNLFMLSIANYIYIYISDILNIATRNVRKNRQKKAINFIQYNNNDILGRE
jgi:hypothetical protein